MLHGRTALTAALLVVSTTALAGMPGPTAADWELASVPGAPNAAAVVLERIGTMRIEETSRSSFLDIYVRLKVLTPEGTEYGTVALLSSDFYRTKQIEGRTHLPGGEVLDLPADATFEREYSDYLDTTVVSSALPGVVPGSIIEYQYRIFFDSIFYPRSWYFQDEIPTLLSRITFELPKRVQFAPVVTKTLAAVALEEDVHEIPHGISATYTMRSIPAIPDEPARFPFADLSSRVKVVPLQEFTSGAPVVLFESWEGVIEIANGGSDWGYVAFLAKDGRAKAKSRELTAGIAAARDKAAALYRFVRDEIATEEREGIWAGDKTADTVLADQKGDSAEKALLLYALLDAVGVPARLSWTAPRTNGRIRPDLADPAQLDIILLAVTLDGDRVFLDPSDRRAGFGRLAPHLQGVPALVVDRKKPKNSEWVITPSLPAEQSMRLAKLELVVDEKGAISGTGTLALSGNHAWTRLRWRDTADETREAWTKWLEDEFPGFAIDALELTDDLEAASVAASFRLAQHEDDVLGDEAVIHPAAPLGIELNPFTVLPQQRLTPVQLAFADVDRVETSIRWPKGWVVDEAPEATATSTGAGRFETAVSVDEDARRLSFTRTVAITSSEFVGAQAYAGLRDLYRAAVAADAKTVALVAE